MPWLHMCINPNGIDITDIGENYSLYKDLQVSTVASHGINKSDLDKESFKEELREYQDIESSARGATK